MLSSSVTCDYYKSSQLAVPQFTFYGQRRNRNATNQSELIDFATAYQRYERFVKKLSNTYRPERVKNDVFEAMMAFPLIEDAPIRIDYESTDSVVRPP